LTHTHTQPGLKWDCHGFCFYSANLQISAQSPSSKTVSPGEPAFEGTLSLLYCSCLIYTRAAVSCFTVFPLTFLDLHQTEQQQSNNRATAEQGNGRASRAAADTADQQQSNNRATAEQQQSTHIRLDLTRIRPGPDQIRPDLAKLNSTNTVSVCLVVSCRVEPCRMCRVVRCRVVSFRVVSCRDLAGPAGAYLCLPGPTATHRNLLEFTGAYRDLPGSTGTCRDLPGSVGTDRGLPGPTVRPLPEPTGTYLLLSFRSFLSSNYISRHTKARARFEFRF